MWLLHFLPDTLLAFVVNAVFLIGVAATIITCFLLKYLVRLMPALAPHTFVAQIISVAVLLTGVYFKGGYAAEQAWRDRVAEMQAKVAAAEAESKEANTKLEKKIKEKTKIIQGRQVVVKQYIDREVTKYDKGCVIPQSFVKAHNDSAEKTK